MKLQGRNLSAEMQGDDVKLLHQELRNLGYEVPKKEAEKAIFGASTRKIIIDFQEKQGLKLTGVVDEKVVNLINQEIIKHGPLTDDQALKARPALRDNLSQITKSVFIAGGKEVPKVNAQVIPVERVIDGQKVQQYEVRLDVQGVYLGERASPPPMQGVIITERIPQEQLRDYDKLLTPFVPDHLAIDPCPRHLLKAFNRIPTTLDKNARYKATIFDPDERHIFQDTSYPWSAFGRCETNVGTFSGVMIGPRHLLTCNHGIDWSASQGFDAGWLTFTPAYFDGDAPFGTTYATHTYYVKKGDSDFTLISDDEALYDYVVVVLKDRMGDNTGWLGAREYVSDWNGLAAWWHIGYPGDLTSSQRPTFQKRIEMSSVNPFIPEYQILWHKADIFPGQSGGPMFGFWYGDVGPRAVAVESWYAKDMNGASGGGGLVDLVIRARKEHP